MSVASISPAGGRVSAPRSRRLSIGSIEDRISKNKVMDTLRGLITGFRGDDDGDGDIDKVHKESAGIGLLHRRAKKTIDKWNEVSDQYIKNLRKAETRSVVHMYTLIQRSSGEIVLAAMVRRLRFSWLPVRSSTCLWVSSRPALGCMVCAFSIGFRVFTLAGVCWPNR